MIGSEYEKHNLKKSYISITKNNDTENNDTENIIEERYYYN